MDDEQRRDPVPRHGGGRPDEVDDSQFCIEGWIETRVVDPDAPLAINRVDATWKARNVARYPDAKVELPRIRVAFVDGEADAQSFVIATANKWSEVCSIRFDFVPEVEEAHVRISFAGRGARSLVGTDCLEPEARRRDARGNLRPTMTLGWLDEAVVLHEFGHVLGLVHEHQNPEGGIVWNREVVFRDAAGWPNFWDEETIERNVLKPHERDRTSQQAFDVESIMLYAFPSSWIVQSPDVGLGGAGARAGAQRNHTLSAGDIATVRALYP